MNGAALRLAAEQRADAECAAAVVALERSVELAPEWADTEWFNGQRSVEPKRAMLAGMLVHIRDRGRV